MQGPMVVVSACARELEAWRKRSGHAAVRKGVATELAPGLLALVSGIGPKAAAQTGQELLHLQPSIVFHVGFAGGLRPGLSAGDLVLVTGVSKEVLELGENHETPQTIPPPIELQKGPMMLLRTRLAQLPRRFAQGPILTLSRFSDRSLEKTRLGQESPYLACEMEAAPLRAAADACGGLYVGLRSISDPADEDVVPSLRSTGSTQELQPGKVLRWMGRPAAALDLARMVRGGRRASRSLGEGIEAGLEALRYYLQEEGSP